MKKEELTLYRDLLGEIKTRVRAGQHRAALSANAEMIAMYWDIGRMIATRQKEEGWGSGVIPRLAADLKNELPEEKGFSETNLKRMVQFCREYPGLDAIGAQSAPQLISPDDHPQEGAQSAPQISSVEIVPQAVAQLPLPPEILFGLPWFHHVILIQKLKDLPTRYWYARQAVEQGLSRDTLRSSGSGLDNRHLFDLLHGLSLQTLRSKFPHCIRRNIILNFLRAMRSFAVKKQI